jgi:hypothetical protein
VCRGICSAIPEEEVLDESDESEENPEAADNGSTDEEPEKRMRRECCGGGVKLIVCDLIMHNSCEKALVTLLLQSLLPSCGTSSHWFIRASGRISRPNGAATTNVRTKRGYRIVDQPTQAETLTHLESRGNFDRGLGWGDVGRMCARTKTKYTS